VRRIVILTGAGISAESGLGTFRDEDGLWRRHDLMDLATPEGFARNPALVHDFYNMRRAACAAAQPNAAHHALARLEATAGDALTLVTQNVDRLHEAAGHNRVIHMHGTHERALCPTCTHRWEAPETMDVHSTCPACGATGVRPDVVWFGEMPYEMEAIQDALAAADLFAAIGTSGAVYPAAGFVRLARAAGAQCVEINLKPSDVAGDFHEALLGPATEVVPDWVEGLLSGTESKTPRE